MANEFSATDALNRIVKALAAAGHQAEALADPMRLRVGETMVPVSLPRLHGQVRGIALDLASGEFGRERMTVTRTGRVNVEQVLRAAKHRAAWEAREARQKAEDDDVEALCASVRDLPGSIRVRAHHVYIKEARPARCGFALDTNALSTAGVRRVLEAYRAALADEST